MENAELLQALVDGSDAINIMRERTKRVIGMVESYLMRQSHQCCSRIDWLNYEGATSSWTVYLGLRGTPIIRAIGIPSSTWPGPKKYIFNKEDEKKHNSLDNVQRLYEALPDLIGLLRKYEPLLEDDFEPFVRAAQSLTSLRSTKAA